MFTQKGASQQGFLLLFLLFFPLSLAVAHSCSESQLGSCSQELGLEELSDSSRQGVPWFTCSDDADLSGPASLLATSYPVPLPGPQGFCSFPQAACRVGWDLLIFWSKS